MSKPKLIFEFETQEELDMWYGLYFDGGGESSIMEGFSEDGKPYPEIKVTEVKEDSKR